VRRLRLRLAHVLGAIAAFLAALVLFLAVAVGLFRFAAAAAPHARGTVEAWAERRLGLTLRLRTIDLVWHRLHPEFVLTDVRILGPKGGASVAVSRLAFGISWSALGSGRLRPAWVELDGLSLPMVQGASGRWRLPRALAPLLAAVSSRPSRPLEGGVRLRDARFFLRSPVLGARPLVLDVRRFRLHAGDGRARLALVGRFPAWGDARLRLRYTARGPSPWRPWSARTRWRIAWSFGSLRARALLLGVRPAWRALDPRGRLSGTGGLGGRGLVFDGRAGFVLSGFRWRGSKGAPLGLRLDARIRSGAGRTAVALSALLHGGKEKRSPPPLRLRLVLHPTPAGTETRAWIPLLAFSDLRLALEATRAFAGSGGWVNTIARARLHGRLVAARLTARWHGARPVAWTLEGSLLGARSRAVGLVPGLSLPYVRLALGSAGGGITLASGRLEASDRRWGGEPLRFATRTPWSLLYRRTPSGWDFTLPSLRARGPGGTYRVHAILRLPASGPPRIRLALHAAGLALPGVRSALPTALLGKDFVGWVMRAFPQGGELHGLVFHWRGPLASLPYPHGGGILWVRAQAVVPRLDFARRWPSLEQGSVAVSYRNGTFEAVLEHGIFAGWRPPGARLTIGPNATKARLRLVFSGPAAPPLEALRATPLAPPHTLLHRLLVDKGLANGRLAVVVPFRDPASSTLAGKIVFRDVGLGLGTPVETLNGLGGPLLFTPAGVASPGLTARWLGRPLGVTIADRNGATSIQARGELPAASLLAALDAGRAPAWVGGVAPWTFAAVLRPGGRGRFVVHTDLRGVRIGLHAPLGKTAALARSLLLVARTGPRGTRIRGRYGRLARWYVRAVPGGWNGALSFGQGRPVLPGKGLALEGRLPSLDLRDLRRLLALGPRGRPPPAHPSGPVVRLRGFSVGRILGYGQDFGPLTIAGSLSADRARLVLASRAVAGRVGWTRDARRPRGLLRLDFTRLDLALRRARPASVRPSPPRPRPARPRISRHLPRPGRFPALDFRSLATRLGPADLGRLVARFRPAPHAWILSRLADVGPGYRLEAHGYWARHAGTDRVRFLFTLTSGDVHTAFLAFGLTPLMTGKSATVQGDIGWHGVPWRLDRPTLSGVLSLRATQGRVLPLNPGAGRLLGLLSLSSLPRRLGLDFSDVFDRGLAYNTVAGRFRIAHGIATVPDLVLRGPAVRLRLEGRTDIVHETYDEVVRVVPLVSASLPLAGALVGGPVGFAALLVFSRMFSLPMRALLATYYHIGGTWRRPLVRRIGDDEARRLGFQTPPAS
jgi:uncharacterized protein YhdP